MPALYCYYIAVATLSIPDRASNLFEIKSKLGKYKLQPPQSYTL